MAALGQEGSDIATAGRQRGKFCWCFPAWLGARRRGRHGALRPTIQARTAAEAGSGAILGLRLGLKAGFVRAEPGRAAVSARPGWWVSLGSNGPPPRRPISREQGVRDDISCRVSKFVIRHFEVFQPLACASIPKNVCWFTAKVPWFAREIGGERDGADHRWSASATTVTFAIEARVPKRPFAEVAKTARQSGRAEPDRAAADDRGPRGLMGGPDYERPAAARQMPPRWVGMPPN